MRKTQQQLLTVNQAAEIIGVSPIRVRQFIQGKRIAFENFGQFYLLPRDGVEKFAKIPRIVGHPKKNKNS